MPQLVQGLGIHSHRAIQWFAHHRCLLNRLGVGHIPLIPAEAGNSLVYLFPGQPELHGETLSQKNQNQKQVLNNLLFFKNVVTTIVILIL